MSIELKSKGDYNKITKYLSDIKNKMHQRIIAAALERYGQEGVDALSAATPVRSGLTASSWRYEVEVNDSGAKLVFHNDNINKHVNIAIILQHGHGTGTGGWVEGIDYINPAIRPLFEKIPDEVWKEVSGL